MRYQFEEIKLKATKRWKENGRWRQETRTFMQTLSPFNTVGTVLKTRGMIMVELIIERDRWLAEERP